MTAIDITLEQLRSCIGHEVVLEGERYRIVEILDDVAPTLVLFSDTIDPVIQANQHGEASRRVPVTRSVPVYSVQDRQLHPLFLKLNLTL